MTPPARRTAPARPRAATATRPARPARSTRATKIPKAPKSGPGRALVTGATGYVGSQLVPALLAADWEVTVLTRSAARVLDFPWGSDEHVTVVEGDVTCADDLRRALTGVRTAYYLVHSMDGEGDFEERDRLLATLFAHACADAEISRIVYLGGLHPQGELSPHLASRVEVGEILMASGVPTACLQAAVVIGDGSVSFDMLRYLTERLPVMIAPTWLNNAIQPIAIADAVYYLVAAATLPPEVNRTFDIGGPDVLTYAEMIRQFARLNHLGPRLIQTLPVMTPWLASHWVGIITPVESGVAKPLVGSLVHEVVCRENDIASYVPDPPGGRTGFGEAVMAAMATARPSPNPIEVAREVAGSLMSEVAVPVAHTVADIMDSVRRRLPFG